MTLLLICLTGRQPGWAQTQTLLPVPTRALSALAASADASHLVIGDLDSGLWTSTNSGNTWISNSVPVQHWVWACSSADGISLVAASGDGLILGSTNGGAAWFTNSVPSLLWNSVACSADGGKIYAVSGLGAVLASTDGGSTWFSNSIPATPNQWNYVKCSADGKRAVIASDVGTVFTFTNGETNWLPVSGLPAARWQGLALSADGTKMMMTGFTNWIYISQDFGLTWRSNMVSGVTNWNGCGESSDGSRLFAGSAEGMYGSIDSGITWSNLTNISSPGIFPSADGTELFAWFGDVFFNGLITTEANTLSEVNIPGPPKLDLVPTTNQIRLSWTVPATNLNLQIKETLLATNWSIVPYPAVLNLTNLQNEVYLRPTGSAGFFRLASP